MSEEKVEDKSKKGEEKEEGNKEERRVSYRKDIDGLRGVAVLSVIIFHFYKSLLPGGFLGLQ